MLFRSPRQWISRAWNARARQGARIPRPADPLARPRGMSPADTRRTGGRGRWFSSTGSLSITARSQEDADQFVQLGHCTTSQASTDIDHLARVEFLDRAQYFSEISLVLASIHNWFSCRLAHLGSLDSTLFGVSGMRNGDPHLSTCPTNNRPLEMPKAFFTAAPMWTRLFFLAIV